MIEKEIQMSMIMECLKTILIMFRPFVNLGIGISALELELEMELGLELILQKSLFLVP